MMDRWRRAGPGALRWLLSSIAIGAGGAVLATFVGGAVLLQMLLGGVPMRASVQTTSGGGLPTTRLGSANDPVTPGSEPGAQRIAIDAPADPTPPAELTRAERLAADDARRAAQIRAGDLARNEDSLAGLSDAALADPDPGNRRRAVRALWLAAADGLGADGTVRARIEDAARDRDPRVVGMAERALADLEALDAREAAREADRAVVSAWTHDDESDAVGGGS